MIQLLLLILTILYMFLITRKGFLVSASFYWLMLFSFIYIIPLIFPNEFITIVDIRPETLRKLELLSLIALLSFISCNAMFLRRSFTADILSYGKLKSWTITLKKLYKLFILFVIVLLVIIISFGSINSFDKLLSVGSQVLVDKEVDALSWLSGILTELCIFCLIMVSFLMIDEVRTIRQKFIVTFLIICAVTLASIMMYARRIIIFPVTVIFILQYIRSKNKKKFLLYAMPFTFVLVILMMVMITIRTYGINNIMHGLSIIFNMNDTAEIMSYVLMITDFSASTNFLAMQLQTSDVSVTPLVYLKPLFFFIPRSLWPDKPEATCVLIMQAINFNQDVLNFSAATGLIGEAFATLGMAGVLIIPSIWGIGCGLLDSHIYRHYMNHATHKQNTLAFYAYLFFIIQTITGVHRGDTSNAIIEFMSTYLPGLILLNIFLTKKRIFSLMPWKKNKFGKS